MDYNKSYNKGLALLFYEIGKTKIELDAKIAKLKKLTGKSAYCAAAVTVTLKLCDIERDLDKYDKTVKSNFDVLNFELTSEVLDELKMRVYECEALLFKALRSTTACSFCKKSCYASDTDE